MSERRGITFGPLPETPAPAQEPTPVRPRQRQRRLSSVAIGSGLLRCDGFDEVVSLSVSPSPRLDVTMFGDTARRYIGGRRTATAVLQSAQAPFFPTLGEVLAFRYGDETCFRGEVTGWMIDTHVEDVATLRVDLVEAP